MKVVKQYGEICQTMDPYVIMRHLTDCGNICYHGNSKDADAFVKQRIAEGHESVIEHITITAHAAMDRGISHELVRHRIASYSHESTRFCNYTKDKFGGHISFIMPFSIQDDYLVGLHGTAKDIIGQYAENTATVPTEAQRRWIFHMESCEQVYNDAINIDKLPPQDARDNLPMSTKSDIFFTFNLREWRHFFKLRALGYAGKPHPKMQRMALDLLMQMFVYLPAVFGDLHGVALDKDLYRKAGVA